MKLFDNFVETKKKPKKKGTILIQDSVYTCEDRKGKPFFSVDFTGHNEGSGSPCNTEEEIQAFIKRIMETKGEEYNISIEDKRNLYF